MIEGRKDYYQILGVPETASRSEIRERFLELARELHPDKFDQDQKREAEERFQAITEAFNILYNPHTRSKYDLERKGAQTESKRVDHRKEVFKAYLVRGKEALKNNDFREAAKNFFEATKVNPDDSKAFYYLAFACFKDPNMLDRAENAIMKAIRLSPTDGKILKLAGNIYYKKGDVESARQYFEKALDWLGEDIEIEKKLQALQSKKKKGLFNIFRKS